MNVLVIPDVHLKPYIFDKADTILNNYNCDKVVLLGDFVDDWFQSNNIGLYNKTFDRLIKFLQEYDCLVCWGNHDLSYVWNKHDAGFSYIAQLTVIDRIREVTKLLNGTYSQPNDYDRAAIIHRIDNVVFSHGGLTNEFVKNHIDTIAEENNKQIQDVNIDDIINSVNHYGKITLSEDNSPIWARPIYHNSNTIYTDDIAKFQVVGHTPVKKPRITETCVLCDDFSTNERAKPYGCNHFVIIDTQSLHIEVI